MNEVFNDWKVNSTSLLKYTYWNNGHQEQRIYFRFCNTFCHQMNHKVTFSRWDQRSRSPSVMAGGSSNMKQKNSSFLEPPVQAGQWQCFYCSTQGLLAPKFKFKSEDWQGRDCFVISILARIAPMIPKWFFWLGSFMKYRLPFFVKLYILQYMSWPWNGRHLLSLM